MSEPLYLRLWCLLLGSIACVATVACAGIGQEAASSPPVFSANGRAEFSHPTSRDLTAPCAKYRCIYVANGSGGSSAQGSITIYRADARDNATPVATIAGSRTELDNPQAVAVDRNRNIYVANVPPAPSASASITVYAAGSEGNVPPTLVVSGSNTELSNNYGIGLDRKARIIVTGNAGAEAHVSVFPAGASGNISPVRVITKAFGRNNLFLGLAVDKSSKVYVSSPLGCSCSGKDRILVYGRRAKGIAKPLQSISGNQTELDAPRGIALDGSANIYVANFGTGGSFGSITVYANGATGDARPIQTIAGSNTLLGFPDGIALDSEGSMYVANEDRSVTVYAAGANGNVAPIRQIKGANTGLVGVNAIALR